MIATPFRITPEDFGDAKLGESLQALIGPLNLTLNDVVSILQGNVGSDNLADEVVSQTLTVDVLADAFPFKFSTKVKKPRCVVLGNCVPKDVAHDLSVPFCLQGFTLTDSGQVSVTAITGILASNTYSLTFWVRA